MSLNRSEILFLYDVTNANPNGDPADGNMPRIDNETGINIVTDVRLKRTIRDYLFNFEGHNTKEKDIFVREMEALPDPAKKAKENGKLGIMDGKQRTGCFSNDADNVLNSCIDIRLFGGVLPIEKDSLTFTGPVQFKMGHSLHKVKPMFIKGTGAFASQAGKENKTFREEHILPYSLIAFYGVVNENAAEKTKLTEADVKLLYKSMWYGTKNLITRSKMEHQPRLLLVVTYKDPSFFIGELDKYVSLDKTISDEQLRDIGEVILNLSELGKVLIKNQDHIQDVRIIADSRLKYIGLDSVKNLNKEWIL